MFDRESVFYDDFCLEKKLGERHTRLAKNTSISVGCGGKFSRIFNFPLLLFFYCQNMKRKFGFSSNSYYTSTFCLLFLPPTTVAHFSVYIKGSVIGQRSNNCLLTAKRRKNNWSQKNPDCMIHQYFIAFVMTLCIK